MNIVTEEFLSTVINNVAVSNNLRKWCYVRQNFETIAQNYFGIIVPVEINGVSTENEQKVTLKLVLKLAPTDERYRISGAVTLMFAREIFIYEVVLKKYEEIQYNFPQNSKYIIPRSYYISKEYCKEVIAMEDMCSHLYMPYVHQRFLDIDHITISLQSLAKLHALSFILKHQNIKLYEEISKVCIPLTEATNKRFMDIMRDRLCKALEKFENTKYILLLNDLILNCAKVFDDAINEVAETCICHGDIWKENILFKYEDNIPISACLIDYQTSRIASSAFDVLYLIISSTDSKLRRKYYYNLLDLYYETFAQILAYGGLESQKVYSKQSFQNDLTIVWPACLITANTALWLSSGLQEEGHVRSKKVFKNKEERDEAVVEYKTIIRDIIEDFNTYRK